MIALAAEGLTLIKNSEQLLADAELKIRKLEQTDNNAPAPEPQDNHADFTLI